MLITHGDLAINNKQDMKYLCQTPVILIIYNRPEKLLNLINSLRKVQPKEIFVVADGPKENDISVKNKCLETRHVIDEIDWPCQIHKRFSDYNLGCGHGPAQGISWAFQHVESAIILEDDCIPHEDYFKYCDLLLDLYRYDNRVMMISGNNHTLNKYHLPHSYEFSRHTQTHGWATWKRAWDLYDYDISTWPEVRNIELIKQWCNNDIAAAKFWFKKFEQCYSQENPAYWDFQWTYACWINHAVNIIPSVNLVSNIGYGDEATNTFNAESKLANLKTNSILFPLKHPNSFFPNKILDDVIQKNVYALTFRKKVFLKLKLFSKDALYFFRRLLLK